ncbi:MAG TPA: CHAT domain-containing protein [Polyangia bacterium]
MRLSVSVSGATLAVTFAGETLARKHTLEYDAAATAATARAIVDVLARGNRARTLPDKNLEDLKHHGEKLWRTLVPAELHGELQRGDSLALELDEALVAVPWELMFDGAQFLCRRLSIGRIVATRQPRRGDERRTVGTPVRVLVMAADPKNDLPEVRAEGEAIIDELEKHATVKARLSTAPDRAFALRYLKDYDVVHFAGHADFVADAPGQSGWTLADGKLTADEIVKLGGGRPMPMIVVGNACQSGHTVAWDGDTTAVFGLANAFLTAGVRHYIGTQWEIVDGQSALFAAEFYRHLTDGKAIGAAVRHARAAVVERAGETALAWASYVLYGDPDVRPLHRPEHKGKLSIPSGLRIAARASAPWKRPAATGARALQKVDAAARRLPAWVPAALGGVAAGLVGVTIAAWLMHRKPAPLAGHPTLAGVAVLPLSTGDSAADQQRARDLEACLPMQLSTDGAAVVPPERLMTLVAQTNGAYDKASARALGLAAGARFVLFGNIASGTAHLSVAEVLNDTTVFTSTFPLDNPTTRCNQFAATVVPKLLAEPSR